MSIRRPQPRQLGCIYFNVYVKRNVYYRFERQLTAAVTSTGGMSTTSSNWQWVTLPLQSEENNPRGLIEPLPDGTIPNNAPESGGVVALKIPNFVQGDPRVLDEAISFINAAIQEQRDYGSGGSSPQAIAESNDIDLKRTMRNLLHEYFVDHRTEILRNFFQQYPNESAQGAFPGSATQNSVTRRRMVWMKVQIKIEGCSGSWQFSPERYVGVNFTGSELL